MEGLLLVLVVLSVVLTVVTLVGHGIWVVVAWLLRGGQSASADCPRNGSSLPAKMDRVATGTSCPRCGCSLSLHTGECLVCEWPQPITAGRRHAAVRVELEARLVRLETLGMIDPATRRDLSAAIASHLAEAPVVDVPLVDVPIPGTPPAAPVDPSAVGMRADVADGAESDTVDAGVVAAEIVAASPVDEDSSAADIAQRVHRYATARGHADRAHTDVDIAAADAPEPAPPRRETSEVLAAFMQERNIRWGELVGGLLIVGCSIALVISFWAEIAIRPLLKFVIFNGVSAALFGAGFYTLRRWQIHTTSRGLLIVATLLAPLNFLAIAALTQQTPPTDVLSLSGEVLSLGMFTGAGVRRGAHTHADGAVAVDHKRDAHVTDATGDATIWRRRHLFAGDTVWALCSAGGLLCRHDRPGDWSPLEPQS